MTSILSKIRTKEDLEFLADDIQTLLGEIYQIGAEQHIPQFIKSEFAAASDKSEFLEDLKKEIVNALVLDLTVAKYLDETELNIISRWVKSNVGTSVVLSIKVDPAVVAGAQMSFQGKFADYTYKTRLEGAINNIIT